MNNIDKILINSLIDKVEIKYEDASLYVFKNNMQNEYKNMFGFLKLSLNNETNMKLFKLLNKYLKDHKIEKIIGPINHSTWFSYRIALNHPELNIFPEENYNANLINIFKELGYKQFQFYKSIGVKLKNEGVTYANLSDEYTYLLAHGDECLKYTKDIYEISIDGFKNSFLYNDITYDEYLDIYLKRFKGKVEPDLLLIKKGDIPIAYFFGYQNIDKEYYVCKTIAIKQEYQGNRKLAQHFMDYFFKFIKHNHNQKFVFHYQKEFIFQRVVEEILFIKEYALYLKETKQ